MAISSCISNGWSSHAVACPLVSKRNEGQTHHDRDRDTLGSVGGPRACGHTVDSADVRFPGQANPEQRGWVFVRGCG